MCACRFSAAAESRPERCRLRLMCTFTACKKGNEKNNNNKNYEKQRDWRSMESNSTESLEIVTTRKWQRRGQTESYATAKQSLFSNKSIQTYVTRSQCTPRQPLRSRHQQIWLLSITDTYHTFSIYSTVTLRRLTSTCFCFLATCQSNKIVSRWHIRTYIGITCARVSPANPHTHARARTHSRVNELIIVCIVARTVYIFISAQLFFFLLLFLHITLHPLLTVGTLWVVIHGSVRTITPLCQTL